MGALRYLVIAQAVIGLVFFALLTAVAFTGAPVLGFAMLLWLACMSAPFNHRTRCWLWSAERALARQGIEFPNWPRVPTKTAQFDSIELPLPLANGPLDGGRKTVIRETRVEGQEKPLRWYDWADEHEVGVASPPDWNQIGVKGVD